MFISFVQIVSFFIFRWGEKCGLGKFFSLFGEAVNLFYFACKFSMVMFQ